MNCKKKRTAERLLQIILIALACSCASNKTIIPYQQNQVKQKVNVGLNVDQKANFSFTVSTQDPVELRTFVMQGFDVVFSGEYEYMVKVPSAKDVENLISRHPGEVKATLQGDKEKRPDIKPVLEALNKTEVYIFVKGKKMGKVKKFNVSVDPASGTLTYAITLPTVYSMNLPFSVSLLSQRAVENDEFNGSQYQNRNTSDRPQPFGVGQQTRPDDKQKELSIKYYFGNSTTKP